MVSGTLCFRVTSPRNRAVVCTAWPLIAAPEWHVKVLSVPNTFDDEQRPLLYVRPSNRGESHCPYPGYVACRCLLGRTNIGPSARGL